MIKNVNLTPEMNKARLYVFQWANLNFTTQKDGDALEAGLYGDKSFHVSGTFGVSGTVQIEGSNTGSDWAILKDPFGNALVITGAGIYEVTELCRYCRPNVTNGDGTTDLTVTAAVRGINS